MRYIEKEFKFSASTKSREKSWFVSSSRERAHILGYLYSNRSEDTQGNKEIQVLFKRSKEVIKLESLETYKGMLYMFITDFSD